MRTLKIILTFTFLVEIHVYALGAGIREIKEVETKDSSSSFVRLGIDKKGSEQKYCLLTWDENGISKIEGNDSVNIRDFSIFTRGLYLTYLKDNPSKGVPLSARERALLKVCLLSQIATLNSYTYVFYKELGFDDEKTQNSELESKYLLPQTTHDTKKNIDGELAPDLISISSMREMQKRFINPNSDYGEDDVCKRLKNFAGIFKIDDKKKIKEDIENIKNDRLVSHKFGTDEWIRFRGWSWKKDPRYDKCKIIPDEFSRDWIKICDDRNLCEYFVKDMLKHITDLRSSSGKNLDKIDKVDTKDASKHTNDVLRFCRTYEDLVYADKVVGDLDKIYKVQECLRDSQIWFNDFPTLVCEYRCMDGIIDALLYRNDLEEIKQVLTDFNNSLGKKRRIPLQLCSNTVSDFYIRINDVGCYIFRMPIIPYTLLGMNRKGRWTTFRTSLDMPKLDPLFKYKYEEEEEKNKKNKN